VKIITPGYGTDDALGSGLTFPLRIDHSGGLGVVRAEEKVRQSIVMILSTAKGERVMRPEFGCDIHSFVFTTLDATNITLIKSAVREALVRWEPRIELTSLDVKQDAIRLNHLLIGVGYRIRQTNFQANLVYPFYLQPGS